MSLGLLLVSKPPDPPCDCGQELLVLLVWVLSLELPPAAEHSASVSLRRHQDSSMGRDPVSSASARPTCVNGVSLKEPQKPVQQRVSSGFAGQAVFS